MQNQDDRKYIERVAREQRQKKENNRDVQEKKMRKWCLRKEQPKIRESSIMPSGSLKNISSSLEGEVFDDNSCARSSPRKLHNEI